MFTGAENLALLEKPKKIIITTHHKPDGDALGSSLGLYHWLHRKGHQVNVVVSSDFPSFLDWIPGRYSIVSYPDDPEAAQLLFDEADIIFCLDYSVLSRADVLEPIIRAAKGQKWMIDHHLEPEDFADLLYWDAGAAATAQLIYTFLADELDGADLIDDVIATCLYTGIMTDTGSFRFRSTTADVHRIVACLIEKGARNWEIHDHVYNNSSVERMKFLGHALLNCLEVVPEYDTAFFKISKEDLKRFNITTGDTEGLVNYALSLKGIRLAALFVDRTELIKLSLRSVGDISVNEIAKKHFNGGGHLNAAGGSSTETLDQVVERFKAVLPEYKEVLTH